MSDDHLQLLTMVLYLFHKFFPWGDVREYPTVVENLDRVNITSNNHIKLIMCLNTPIGVNLSTYYREKTLI